MCTWTTQILDLWRPQFKFPTWIGGWDKRTQVLSFYSLLWEFKNLFWDGSFGERAGVGPIVALEFKDEKTHKKEKGVWLLCCFNSTWRLWIVLRKKTHLEWAHLDTWLSRYPWRWTYLDIDWRPLRLPHTWLITYCNEIHQIDHTDETQLKCIKKEIYSLVVYWSINAGLKSYLGWCLARC